MLVEPARPDDREPILAVTRSVGVFNAEEEATVAELFDGYLRGPHLSGYNFLVYRDAAEDGAVLGFACWGPTALSKGAADLYWIATSQAAQGRGVAPPRWSLRGPAVQPRLGNCGLIRRAGAHGYQRRRCFRAAKQWRAADWAKQRMHHVAALGDI